MKKISSFLFSFVSCIICMQIAVSAASTPPKRPIVNTGNQNVSYSTPIDIRFKEISVVIPMDEYDNNNPYRAYYFLETDSEGEPLISIGNMCDSGEQIYSMTDEVDRYGTYIAIYPYKIGKDRLILSSQVDESISDTLIINIVESLDNTSSSREKTDIIKPPSREVDLSGTTSTGNKPERPVVETTDNDEIDYEDDDFESKQEYEEIIIYKDVFTDVSSDYEHYISIFALKEAGIISGYSNGEFRPHNTITRAEACSIIINALNNPSDISSKGNFFDDTRGHWAEEIITKAKNMGIINGINECNFAPEENITDEQLTKVLVSLLGFGKQATHLGGYPNGYIKIASDIGLLKDVNVCVGNCSERGSFAQMVYNALNTHNAGEYELVKLPDIKNYTTEIQVKPVNKVPATDTETKDNTDDEYYFTADYDNDILETVTASISYITDEEAIIVSNCIEKSIRKGTWETSNELYNIALRYCDEALLEEVSDIFNKLMK